MTLPVVAYNYHLSVVFIHTFEMRFIIVPALFVGINSSTINELRLFRDSTGNQVVEIGLEGLASHVFLPVGAVTGIISGMTSSSTTTTTAAAWTSESYTELTISEPSSTTAAWLSESSTMASTETITDATTQTTTQLSTETTTAATTETSTTETSTETTTETSTETTTEIATEATETTTEFTTTVEPSPMSFTSFFINNFDA